MIGKLKAVWVWMGKEYVFLGAILLSAIAGFLKSAHESLHAGAWFQSALAVLLCCMTAWSYWTKWRHQVK